MKGLDYEERRDRDLNGRLRQRSLELEQAQSQVATLIEALRAVSEEGTFPLWRRIANQRRALRSEIWWRTFWEKMYRDKDREVTALKKRIRDLEAS